MFATIRGSNGPFERPLIRIEDVDEMHPFIGRWGRDGPRVLMVRPISSKRLVVLGTLPGVGVKLKIGDAYSSPTNGERVFVEDYVDTIEINYTL